MAEKKSNTKPKKEAEKKPAEKPKTEKKTETKAKAPEKVKTEAKAEASDKKEQKSSKGWIFGIITAAAIIVGVVLGVCLGNKADQSDPTMKLSYTEAFFISDNGKYMLWNADGKRLTEEDYSSQSNFVGGYAYVRKDDQYGIIKDDGKMSVDLGKYGSIVARGGLYLAQDGNTKEYFLITGGGKVLERGDNLDVYAPGSGAFAVVKIDDKYKIYTAKGDLVKEVAASDDASDPRYDNSHDFGVVYSNNKNWVFDARDGKLIAEFEGPRYTFDSVTDDREKILLESDDDYKLLADGKVYDLNETKYYAFTALDDVIGYDNYDEVALLNKDYKVVKRVNTYLDLKDSDNYATESEDGGVEIYKNGEKIKTFGEDSSISASGVLYEDYYAIEDDDKAMFYNLDGTVGIDHEFKAIKSLFNKHHHAIVSDDGKECYLIDAKGNRIGDVAAVYISARDGGYEFRDSDGKYAITDKNGEPVTEFKYDSTYYRSNAIVNNIWTGRNSTDNYDVIDVDNHKVILENANVQSFYNNYFTVKNSEGKTEYYTYKGELFYTSEK